MNEETKNQTNPKPCSEGGPHRLAISGILGLPYCLDCDYDWGD